MSTKYHGIKGSLFQGVTSAGAPSPVTTLTDWKLDITQDLAEVTCLGDTWKSFVAGALSATGSFSGYFASDEDIPFDAFDVHTTVNFYGYPGGSTVAKYFYGSVWPSKVGIDCPVGGPVAISGDLTVNGTLGRIG